jgi:hypothetical protein
MSYEPNWYMLLQNYGISKYDYQLRMTQQDFRCMDCKVSFDEVRPEVDHDHETGVVRALLCHPCNKRRG